MAASMSAFLNVTDIDRSIAFYRALGFRLDKAYKDDETGGTTYADLSYQGAELGLGNLSANDDPEFQAWVSTPLGAGVVLYLSVPDVDRIHEKARAAGATIEFPPTDRPYGRLFMLNDPDGYSVSFIREPRAPRKAAGKGTRRSTTKAAKRAGAKGARKGATRGASKGAGKKAAGKKAIGKKAAGRKAAKIPARKAKSARGRRRG